MSSHEKSHEKRSLSETVRGAAQALRRPEVLFAAVALLAMAVGFIGVGGRIWFGKTVTALGSYVPWGLWIGVYVYLVWLEIGSLLVYAVLTYVFRWKALTAMRGLVYFTALIILVIALLTILLDIGHMFRFWKVYAQPAWSSPIAWMVWFHTAYLALLAAETWFALRPALVRQAGQPNLAGKVARVLLLGRTELSPEAREQGERILKVLGWMSIPLGAALISVIGAIFGVVAARPYWNATILPLVFLVNSMVAGGALLTFQYVAFWRHRVSDLPAGEAGGYPEVCRQLGRILLGLLVVALYAALVNAVLILYPNVPSHAAAVKIIFYGPYWYSFWIFHVLLGIVVPLVLLIRFSSPFGIGTAAFLMAATFIVIPLNIVIPAQLEPQLKGLAEAYMDARLVTSYFPNLMEWLVVLFMGGFGLLLFVLGLRYLPLRPARLGGKTQEEV